MKRAGERGEDAAAEYLQGRGYEIVARNWRSGRTGEIDIVARNRKTLVIVEVKTARGTGFGDPLGWISPRKVRQLGRLAEAYLAAYREPFDAVRFDAVSVDLRGGEPLVMHLIDAFRPGGV